MKIITALVTPFKDDLSINYEMLDRLIEKQIEEEASGIVIGGTTGEIHLLTHEEMFELYQYVTKYSEKIPIYLGVGCASTSETIALIKRFNDYPIAGFLVVCPYYVLPPQKGLIKHFQLIDEASEKPVILYHIPKRTGSTMDIESILTLQTCKNIKMIKEASLDQARLLKLKESLPWEIYLGDDSLFLWGIDNQIDGIISVISNTHLPLMKKCCLDKDYYLYYLQALALIKGEPNPIGIKKLYRQLGINVGTVRLPLLD